MDERLFLAQLRLHCPAYTHPPPDCPLHSLPNSPNLNDILTALQALPDEHIQQLLRQHFLCLCRKDGCEISNSLEPD